MCRFPMVIALALLLPAAAGSIDVAATDGCIDRQADASSTDAPDISPLAIARNLQAPLASDTRDAEFEHDAFWEDHGPLLQDAWKEWEEGIDTDFDGADCSFLNPKLLCTRWCI